MSYKHLALVFSLTTLFSSAEAAWLRHRRSRFVCGAALLTAAIVSVDLWMDPPRHRNQPNTPTQATGTPFRVFEFEETGMTLFHESWLDQSVADRLKSRLEKDFPQLANGANWKKPGVPVLLSALTLIPDPEDAGRVYVRLTGEFLEVISTESMSLSEFESGLTQKLSYHYDRQEDWGTSAHLDFDLTLRYLSVEVTVESTLEGKFSVKGPAFTHSDEFREGPWKAVHPRRLARQ